MGKNRNYSNEYKITVSGKTTNGFTAKVMHKLLVSMVAGLANSTAQTDVTLEVLSTTGDFDAVKGEYKEGL